MPQCRQEQQPGAWGASGSSHPPPRSARSPIIAMFLVLIWTMALGCLVSGCRSAARRSTSNPRIHAQEDIKVTQEQLRVRMRALVGPTMCTRIEQSADSIIAATDDEKIKEAALQWKIDGVPAVRQALFQTEPFVALTYLGVVLTDEGLLSEWPRPRGAGPIRRRGGCDLPAH
jgi:hypothetical protein